MHYYHYKYEEVMNMNNSQYLYLVKLMSINEARKTLKGFEVAIYPKLKDQKRTEIHRKHYKIAFPSNFEVKNVVKLSDLNKVIR